jgi:hypothetical protein
MVNTLYFVRNPDGSVLISIDTSVSHVSGHKESTALSLKHNVSRFNSLYASDRLSIRLRLFQSPSLREDGSESKYQSELRQN